MVTTGEAELDEELTEELDKELTNELTDELAEELVSEEELEEVTDAELDELFDGPFKMLHPFMKNSSDMAHTSGKNRIKRADFII